MTEQLEKSHAKNRKLIYKVGELEDSLRHAAQSVAELEEAAKSGSSPDGLPALVHSTPPFGEPPLSALEAFVLVPQSAVDALQAAALQHSGAALQSIGEKGG
eukprot:CAMPEP_0180303214 /NCGR_PEP_ID=MMETSP0988-20121125/24852_1 /TAXON_ID=697907 /ORGANISM="non described non described, Strain CCMP2293" /LENGTH=101 /DNA_ID=CAMNT_0022284723 /DNA_START=38 /DNA_END=340 /DNA_ORIENTATION=+